MNLIQRIKFWRELKRLETRARETPAPTTFVDLAQVYINLGQIERTVQIAEEGLALFPNSEELRKLRRFAKKSQLNDRIKQLRQSINKAATPELYRDLASCYLELGDLGAVNGTCEECLRRFPKDVEAYLVLGKARLALFYKELTAAEGISAVQCLQHVVEIEPGNLKAHRLLGEVYYRIGALAISRRHVEILKGALPEDPEVAALWDEVDKARGQTEEDFAVRFHLVQRTGSFARGPITGERKRQPRAVEVDEFESARHALAVVSRIPGVVKCAYIRGSRALVKGEIKDGKDSLLRVVRVLAKAAHRTARRMDLGNFSKGVLEGDFGRICICSYGEVVAAALCSEDSAITKVLAELQELVAGSLFVAGSTNS